MVAPLARLRPRLENYLRILARELFRRIHGRDLVRARGMVRGYWHPASASASGFVPGADAERLTDALACPFVYESPDAPHLKALREAYGFDRIVAGAADEYEAMIRLATWLGARWDHGKDPVPGGPIRFDAREVLEAGARGSRFWCEIAAKVAVQAFTAMGWPARLVTTSRDGHTWEHALVEAWSNRFGRWIAMDTDFNFLYEADGVPLSAWGICHRGEALQAQGRLQVRMLGASKPSLPMTDLLPFFAYVHIDLRSDWHTRRLPWGSPAGGDLATWWTARPAMGRLASPRIRVDGEGRFDWPVNAAWIEVEESAPRPDGHAVHARLLAYAPYFAGFQYAVDGGPWRDAPEARFEAVLGRGAHSLAARVRVSNGGYGPAHTLRIVVPQPGTSGLPAPCAGVGSGA